MRFVDSAYSTIPTSESGLQEPSPPKQPQHSVSSQRELCATEALHVTVDEPTSQDQDYFPLYSYADCAITEDTHESSRNDGPTDQEVVSRPAVTQPLEHSLEAFDHIEDVPLNHDMETVPLGFDLDLNFDLFPADWSVIPTGE